MTVHTTVSTSDPPAIRLLSPDLVAKIAAGEVVERPASVVKELVENAVDAGADTVRLEIQRGGLGLIRIADNGAGIAPEQLEMAVCRHATSKLTAFDDLYRVRTLGFRGEALASIAAVSQLELTSRPASGPVGGTLRVEGGRIISQGATGCPTGTTVAVRHLFYNVPARHAFQRSPAGESRQIVQLCQHLALSAPRLRLLVEVEGRLALQAPGNGDLRDALAAAYGAAAAGHMLVLPELEEDGMRVWGYCSGPEEHRNTRLYCTFVVNGRLIRSQMLTYAVQEAYHALLPGGRHPLAAIHLTVPPDDLDVNVHPTKIEVRFRHDRRVFSLLRRALRQALAAFAPIPALQPQAIGFPALPGAPGAPGAPGGADGSGAGTPPGLGALTPADLAAALAYETPAAGAGQPVLVSAPAAPPPRETTEAGRGRPGAGGLRALGQIGLTYIVAEDASGLYLIDQHSAHERVVYEQLLKEDRQSLAEDDPTGATSGAAAQLLLAPETVDLNAAQEAWLQEHAPTLHRFGFQMEPFGGHTWLMRAVPRSLVARGRARALGELIDNLVEREYGDGPIDDQARWAIACHSAVRAGDRLAAEEMAALIAQLERCDMRRTCPHGRPTMIHLSHAQLEREFGRR